jgi:hypothetical protein
MQHYKEQIMNKETGGPAFPIQERIIPREGFMEVDGMSGITVRDYFAAKAMAALIASAFYDSRQVFDAAKEAYFLADAMLDVRSNS